MTLASVQVLPGPGDAQQRLVALAGDEALAQALDGGGLVAGRLERGDEFEVGHDRSLPESGQFRTGVRSLRGSGLGGRRSARRAAVPRLPTAVGRTSDTGRSGTPPDTSLRHHRRLTDLPHAPRPPFPSRPRARRVRRSRSPAAERGQSLVEFALVMMPLFIILLGDHPVRVHLQRLRDDHQRDPRGRAARHGLRLRRRACPRPRTTSPGTTRSRTAVLGSMNLLTKTAPELRDRPRPGRRAGLDLHQRRPRRDVLEPGRRDRDRRRGSASRSRSARSTTRT